MSTPYKDGIAKLNHFFKGMALPDHLARPRVGPELEQSPHVTGGKSLAQARQELAEITTRMHESVKDAPIVAICHKNKCECGNQWLSFGFYARKVVEKIDGAAPTHYMKPLHGFTPSQNDVTATYWHDKEEQRCLECFGGSNAPNANATKDRRQQQEQVSIQTAH